MRELRFIFVLARATHRDLLPHIALSNPRNTNNTSDKNQNTAAGKRDANVFLGLLFDCTIKCLRRLYCVSRRWTVNGRYLKLVCRAYIKAWVGLFLGCGPNEVHGYVELAASHKNPTTILQNPSKTTTVSTYLISPGTLQPNS